MSSESVRILWEFKKLAENMRAKSNEDGIKNTELELVYEACASSVERTISVANEMFDQIPTPRSRITDSPDQGFGTY